MFILEPRQEEKIRSFHSWADSKNAKIAQLEAARVEERAEASKQLAAKAEALADLARLRMEDHQVHNAQLLQMQQTIYNCQETIAWLSNTGAWSGKMAPSYV